MSVYETSITNPKKQLEFYKDLSKQLEQENQELRIQVSAREEVANKYKEVIDKVTKTIYEIDELRKTTGGYPSNYIDNLLDTLKEVK